MTTPTRELRGAADLWTVKLLGGAGVRMRVRTFQRLLLAGWVATVPTTMLVGTVGVSLSAVLVTDTDAGHPDNVVFATGAGVVLAVVLAYGAVLDLLRQHVTAARYAVSRSPLKGLWLAADIGLVPAVLAERGPALLWRATVQATLLASAGLYVRRTDPVAGGDLLAVAAMLPAAYLCAGLALALRHGARDRGRPHGARVLAVAVPLTLATGWVLARAAGGATVSGPTDPTAGAVARMTELADALPAVRLGALVVLVLAIAAITLVLAVTDGHELERRPADRTPSLAGRDLAAVLLHGAGGPARLQVGARVCTVLALAALLVLGWRLGGGAAVPDPHWPVAERALALVAAGTGMAIATTTLLLVGQTRRLWHHRALWELGVPVRDLVAGTLRPTLALAALAAAAVVALGAGLGGSAHLAVLVLLAAVLSEHLVDSMFARTDTSEGARNANSLLAVTGFLFLVPPAAAALARAWWSGPFLVLWLVLVLTGGVWWFSRRVQSLPVTGTV